MCIAPKINQMHAVQMHGAGLSLCQNGTFKTVCNTYVLICSGRRMFYIGDRFSTFKVIRMLLFYLVHVYALESILAVCALHARILISS